MVAVRFIPLPPGKDKAVRLFRLPPFTKEDSYGKLSQ